MQIFVYRSVGDANNAKCKMQNECVAFGDLFQSILHL